MTVTALQLRPGGIQPIPLGRGQWATIRPIESSDWVGLLDFYRTLSPQARYTRFLGMTAGIEDRMAHRFADASARHACGSVAILREAGPADGRVIGHVCIEPLPDGRAEIGIAVADGFRRLGIGRRLMQSAAASARLMRCHRLVATMFAGNEPMRRLLLSAGGRVVRQCTDAGVATVEIEGDEAGGEGGN